MNIIKKSRSAACCNWHIHKYSVNVEECWINAEYL